MTIAITRRQILNEDINWDSDGTGASETIVNPAGGTVNGYKINASHLPTTTALRALMSGTSTVEDTLGWLYENFSTVGGNASTTEKGIIEIATLAEAQAGTDTARAITPYLLKNTKASTTQFGTLALASEAEALAGSDAEKAITSATLHAALDAAAAAPVGSVVAIASETVPSGYLECDGSSLVRTSYANLFTAIGTVFGAADASHFNIPDLRGQFLRGWNHGGGSDPDAATRTDSGDGSTTGDHVGTKQAREIESHYHIDGLGTSFVDGDGNTRYGVKTIAGAVRRDEDNNTGTYANGVKTSSSGGNETRPTNVNVMYCIKY